ncbi:MAG: glycosyltransferase family 2 protein [Gemmatimonadaceae bacterium]
MYSNGNSGESHRVTAIVLNWNGADMTRRCVEHLQAQTTSIDILIIENGSRDDSATRLADLVSSNCRMICIPTNLGFAGGCNLGVREARQSGAEFAWLVNNDAFAAPDCIAHMLQFMHENPNVAMLGPKLLNLDNSEQHAGGVLDWFTGNPNPTKSDEMSGEAVKGRWITGTCPLIRIAALSERDPFNADFFAYWEDVDLSVTLSTKGFDLRVLPIATVHHLTRASTGGDYSPTYLYLMVRNLWLLQRRHLPIRARPGAIFRFTSDSLLRYTHYLSEGQADSANAIFRAVCDAWSGRFGAPPATLTVNNRSFLARHPWRAASVAHTLSRIFDATLRSPVKFLDHRT